jgi:hypothetical protein
MVSFITSIIVIHNFQPSCLCFYFLFFVAYSHLGFFLVASRNPTVWISESDSAHVGSKLEIEMIVFFFLTTASWWRRSALGARWQGCHREFRGRRALDRRERADETVLHRWNLRGTKILYMKLISDLLQTPTVLKFQSLLWTPFPGWEAEDERAAAAVGQRARSWEVRSRGFAWTDRTWGQWSIFTFRPFCDDSEPHLIFEQCSSRLGTVKSRQMSPRHSIHSANLHWFVIGANLALNNF